MNNENTWTQGEEHHTLGTVVGGLGEGQRGVDRSDFIIISIYYYKSRCLSILQVENKSLSVYDMSLKIFYLYAFLI